MLFLKNMDKKKTFDEEKKELSAILNKHKIGDYTSEEETTIITSFFRQYHPEWYEKTKCMEVVKYNIISNNHHCRNGRCFELELSNGYKDDIGYGSLRKNPPNPEKYKRQQITAACREAVRKSRIIPFLNSIVAKKKRGEIIYSEFSKLPIDSINDIQIDHYDLTFDELVEKYIESKGENAINILYSAVNMGERQSTITKFTNNEIIDDFISFHDKNTHLRIVTKQENLSELKRKRFMTCNPG